MRAEAADAVSLAFPEGQTVIGMAVEGALGYHPVVEEAVEEGMYSIGSGSSIGAGVLEVVLGAADIEEVIVGSKVAVNGVAWEETAQAIQGMAHFAVPVVVGAEEGARVLYWIGKMDYVNEVQSELVLGLFLVDNMPGIELINPQLPPNVILLLARYPSNHLHPSIHHQLCQRPYSSSDLLLLPRWHQLNHPKI